jgi:hypothetical protein
MAALRSIELLLRPSASFSRSANRPWGASRRFESSFCALLDFQQQITQFYLLAHLGKHFANFSVYAGFQVVLHLHGIHGDDHLACGDLSTCLGLDTCYYAWTKRPESERATANTLLTARIRSIHEKSDRNYGSPRVTAQLRLEGLQCGRNRVARLMRENKIVSESVTKFKITTTDSNRLAVVDANAFEYAESRNHAAVMRGGVAHRSSSQWQVLKVDDQQPGTPFRSSS